MNKVLCVAAHPDDEILGCGATLAKHVKEKDAVHVLILSTGITSRDSYKDNEIILLSNTAKVANYIIGVSSMIMMNFPDNRFDSINRLELIKVIEKVISEYKPDIVYTHHWSDVNIDHRCIHDATVVACRAFPKQSVKTLLFFEIPSSTEWQVGDNRFMPNWFVDVSNTKEKKFKALKEYKSEMRAFPHPRSIKAIESLMKWRGATIGANFAESFVLGRNIR